VAAALVDLTKIGEAAVQAAQHDVEVADWAIAILDNHGADLDEDVAHGDSQVLAHSHQLGCQHLTACKFRSKYPSISGTYFLCLELSKKKSCKLLKF
jgi:hypothetical protein